MKITKMMWYAGTILMTLALLAASATAAAQQLDRSTRASTAAAKVGDSSRVERSRAGNLKKFRGIAAKLNTTPEALQSAFERARVANPKLSRGNFIAANVLADNLGARHPNITTAAILSGLQSGKNLGQTLQGLGLSASDAKQARRAADRRVKDGDQRVKDEDKRARDREKERRQREKEASGHTRLVSEATRGIWGGPLIRAARPRCTVLRVYPRS